MRFYISRTIFIIFAVGVAIRVLLLLAGLSIGGSDFVLNYGDAVGYVRLAENIAAGNGFSMAEEPPFVSDSTRTPGYPFMLALSLAVSQGVAVAVGLQILIGALIPVVLYYLLREFNFSQKLSLVVSFFFAIEPFFAAQSVFLLSETLFIFLFVVSLLLYIRWFGGAHVAYLPAAAMLLGVATLVRPLALYMVPIFCMHLLFMSSVLVRKRIIAAALLITVSVAVVSPWLIRNYQLFGTARLSSIDSINLYLYQGGSVLAMESGRPFEEEKNKLWEELRREGIDRRDLVHSAELRRRAFAIMVSHPWSFLKLNALVTWQFFTHDAYYDLVQHLGFYRDRAAPPLTVLKLKESIRALPSVLINEPAFLFFVGGRVLWIMLFVAMLGGIFLSLRDSSNRTRDVLLLLLMGYVLVASLSTGYSINARFRLPIAPFYVAYAFYALNVSWFKIRKLKS